MSTPYGWPVPDQTKRIEKTRDWRHNRRPGRQWAAQKPAQKES